MRNRTLAYLILLSISLFSCNKKKEDNWDVENTRDVIVNDPKYLDAIEDARKQLPKFIDLLSNKNFNHYEFFIKAKYIEGENVEHLWFEVKNKKGSGFASRLDNVPLNLKNIKLNDSLEIDISKVEDWVVYKGDSLIAGNFISSALE